MTLTCGLGSICKPHILNMIDAEVICYCSPQIQTVRCLTKGHLAHYSLPFEILRNQEIAEVSFFHSSILIYKEGNALASSFFFLLNMK